MDTGVSESKCEWGGVDGLLVQQELKGETMA